VDEPTTYAQSILYGMQSKQMYEGTVTGDEKKLRRAKAKRQRQARKIQRRNR
jgi:hypothetical protein